MDLNHALKSIQMKGGEQREPRPQAALKERKKPASEMGKKWIRR